MVKNYCDSEFLLLPCHTKGVVKLLCIWAIWKIFVPAWQQEVQIQAKSRKFHGKSVHYVLRTLTAFMDSYRTVTTNLDLGKTATAQANSKRSDPRITKKGF